MKEHNPVFDVIKGFGILIMVWTHCDTAPISHFAYTFHMPLFFFASGFFFRPKNLDQEIALNFRRILVPYLFSFFIMFLIAFVCYDSLSFGPISKKAFFSAVWGGALLGSLPFSNEVLFSGPLWFLLAMIWVRLEMNLLNRIIKRDVLLFCVICILAFVAQGFFQK